MPSANPADWLDARAEKLREWAKRMPSDDSCDYVHAQAMALAVAASDWRAFEEDGADG